MGKGCRGPAAISEEEHRPRKARKERIGLERYCEKEREREESPDSRFAARLCFVFRTYLDPKT